MSMLLDFLREAIEMGADSIEIDYKDGQERICAMRGAMGVTIGSVPSASKMSGKLLAEVDNLRKAKRVKVAGVAYRAMVAKYDSFGETAYRITLAASRRT